jgi:hypothetical protein
VTDEAREAALAERERIACLAAECRAVYSLKFEMVSFAALIRSGATTPPWVSYQLPDPLEANNLSAS